MHWYGGSIAEAVTLSKQKNAIFVVFVEGDNELSTEMTSVLDDAAVLKRLADSTNFLAIKLKSGSSDYTHFAQIYQFVPVPSLFFIGRNGTPLEVVCAGVQAGNLASRIDRILEEHHKDKPAQPSTAPKDIKEQTVDLLSSESTPTAGGSRAPIPPLVGAAATFAQREAESSGPAAKVPKLDDQSEVVCNDGVCIRRPRADGAGPSQSPDTVQQKEPEPESAKLEAQESTLSAEEKKERAKALIEAKRKEKAEKEKELEKEKEKERRNLGQGVAELKRWQADQELKQIQEERKREKLENNLARQRILEQIAQDRAERRARDAAPELPPPQPAHAARQLQEQLMLARAERAKEAKTPASKPEAAKPVPAQTEQSAEPTVPRHLQEQLMQARAERAKEAKTPASKPEAAKPVPAQTEQSTEPTVPTSGDASSHARIQFKLPDGTSHTAQFAADGTLATVQQYVADSLYLPTSQFSLWLAFPRRELVECESTLRGLQLAPSAALLVLPRRATAAVSRPTAVGNIIAFVSQLLTSIIVQPSHRLYSWLMSLVSRPRAPSPARAPSPSPTPSPSPAPASNRGISPGAVRRRGNVHRLQGETPDDDNNTWNGNSTQQM